MACVYLYQYICPGVQGSRPPPKGGGPPGWAAPASGICMPCMHMHAYVHLHEYMHFHIHIYICMHCVCMQAYTRMACMHLCMHAWHEWIYACLMPCAPPYPHPQGGDPHMGGALLQYILWASPLSIPHPPGGGGHHHHSPLTRGGGGGSHWTPGHIYIYIYRKSPH